MPGDAIGDPDTITRQLETLEKAAHFDEFFIWLNQGLPPHEQVLDNSQTVDPLGRAAYTQRSRPTSL